MLRILTLVLAMLAAAIPAPASASAYTSRFPELEQQMLAMLGKVFVKTMFDRDEAATRGECEAGRALLTAKTPKYLAAYVEECFSIAVAPGGPGYEKLRCPYYLRAIEIWRTSPPPMDDDDLALTRIGRLQSWKSYATKSCGAPVTAPRTDMGPLTTIAPGSRLHTQEGISYLVPDGWTVAKFSETSGEARLSHAQSNHALAVSRASLNNNDDYTDKAVLPGGRVLEWKYYIAVPQFGAYVMSGRTKLAGAYVVFYLSRHGDGLSGNSVDKDLALEALKAIAGSAKIEGKRACLGDCGPGKLIAPK